jgi:hypothetical protein
VSIYGSTWDADSTDHGSDCDRWVECFCLDPHGHRHAMLGDFRHWSYDKTRACTCRCGPIVYRGSHILPSDGDERGGWLGFAEIPGFITRDGHDDGPEDEDEPWPFLRASVRAEGAEDCQDLLLDRPLVESLAAYLTDYLTRLDEGHPVDRAAGGDVYPLDLQPGGA